MANQALSDVASKSARIELKTTPEVKLMLEQAARSAGVNLSAFIIAQAQEQARRIIAESSVIRLNAEAWSMLEEAVQNPAPPTEALRALMNRRKR
ncbi:DUF1778 domain-containing protein [Pokkaliibacter sp. MBI-7]|uniref:type II toxin-antitoxin system TacA family antitoxin n=1 Tax=Pokkaliibacter sp. MBI-7 TaxID=3040600 RepID=UPI00244864E9|nr:DUF1778 domain-containing protein [Pokkaliibacter sp. MBI-7]MDH2431050.1 DUF1778 domain-containing protein [Pokkaliibacter sp. MBI-7]MDH2436745.1 DUF1778 domain-containing protein [Pokkaliibacter sp. MBI-7]